MRAASNRRRGGRTAPADRGQPASRAAFDFDFLRSAAEEPMTVLKHAYDHHAALPHAQVAAALAALRACDAWEGCRSG